MWSSGRSSDNRSVGGSDPERERRVRSDAARKRGARRWTNRGMSPPASFRVRETEEYDRRQDVVAVKEEPEEVGRRGVVGPEDFVADVEAVAAAIAERSLHEEAERRRHDEEIEDLQWRQAVEANIAAKAKDAEWRRIREEQKAMYIDLGSSDEED
ncbi:CDPK-related protein kinase [Hordeum vulgare]|nr:CDPK-related protein kinase [Hordeum vulgare]